MTITKTGTQPFMGREIPIVLGGFGPNARCVCDKTVAELHGQPEREIRRRITDNIRRFTSNVDYIDLAQRVGESHTLELLTALGYAKQSITQAEHIYILSERGYAKLVKIMDTDQAWDVYNHLLDEYFLLRETARESFNVENLSPALQMFKAIFDSVARTELAQKEQAAALEAVNQKVDGIRDVVALNPHAWRQDCRNLLAKVAQARGGGDAYREVNREVFQLVDERAGVSLETRLTNKRRRMADEGVCKSRRDKLTKVDVISEDKKLIEIYTAIVKEMAVAHGITTAPASKGTTES